MPRLNVFLEARSPLLLGNGLAVGNVQESRPYVAGSVWRGALARSVLQAQGRLKHAGRPVLEVTPSSDFSGLFLGENAAHFDFLYPVRQPNSFALPIPLTVRTCKQKPGFAPDGHGVYDGLFNRLREAARGERPYSRDEKPCSQCQGRLERRRGYMSRTADNATDYGEAKPGRQAFVRVGLNRHTETAQEQVLYLLETLIPTPDGKDAEPALSFAGAWRGSSEQEQILRAWLDEYLLPEDDGYRLEVGTARARGMGHAILRLNSDEDGAHAITAEELADRLVRFQPTVAGRPIDPAHLYAALTLRSPLTLKDERGLSAERITPDLLRAYQPSVPPGLEVLSDYSVLEREIWTGWSAAWGLPKPVTTVISAGSVLVLRAPTSQQTRLLDYLTTLDAKGLGEHCAEGFGEVLVCDLFHIVFDEKEL